MRLLGIIIMLCIAGAAAAQDSPAPKGFDAPAHPGLKPEIGVQYYSQESAQKTYLNALTVYAGQAALDKTHPNTTGHATPAPDCAMIIWADTTTTVPMPTLQPAPNLDLKTPTLRPDTDCSPPLRQAPRPDSSRTLPFLPKKYPMKLPRR